MTDVEVTEVMNEVGGADRDIHGWTWGPMRIERGGGIAGNSHDFWIRFPGEPDVEAMGPYRSKTEFRKALREFFIAVIQAGIGIQALGVIKVKPKAW